MKTLIGVRERAMAALRDGVGRDDVLRYCWSGDASVDHGFIDALKQRLGCYIEPGMSLRAHYTLITFDGRFPWQPRIPPKREYGVFKTNAWSS